MTQLFWIFVVSFLSLPRRLGGALVAMIGSATAAGVITAMYALADGFDDVIAKTARSDRAVILADNARDSGASQLSDEHIRTIAVAPGIRRSPAGDLEMIQEVRASVQLRSKRNDILRGVLIRGYSQALALVRPEVRIVAGRMFTPGLREAIVGEQVIKQLRGVEIGARLPLESSAVKIVGVFESGDWIESGLIMDSSVLLTDYGRVGANCVVVKLAETSSLQRLKQDLSKQGSLRFQVLSEGEYYHRVSGEFAWLSLIANLLGSIMALGATFGAWNAMSASVDGRAQEISVLRALGFGRLGIVLSVIIESLTIAITGALVGAGIAWLIFDGLAVTAGSDFASVLRPMSVSVQAVACAVLWAVAIGISGALWPAARAVTRPI